MNLESLIQGTLLSFKINTSILKVYFKYTSEFENKWIPGDLAVKGKSPV